MNIFSILIEQPIINILVAVYQVLVSLNAPHAFGYAIIALSVIVRLAISPFMSAQLKYSKKMQEMAPHISRIKEKHKGDMAKQSAAQAEFMKEQGVSMLGGCLPALIQFPIIIGLFFALQRIANITKVADINNLLYHDALKLTTFWDTNFFGIPINKAPKDLLATIGIGVLVIVLVTALLQLIQALMAPVPHVDPNAVQAKNNKPDMSTMIQKQMLFFLPIVLGYSSFTLPIGISIYWNTFSLFGILQQYQISGWGRMETVFSKLKRQN